MTNEPQAPRPTVDPRQGGALARLGRGFGYIFAGWRFVGQHRELIKYCIAPWLISLVAFAAVVVLAVLYQGELVDWIWKKPDSWVAVFWYVLYVVILAAVVLLCLLLFFVLQALLAAPFNDLISEHVEALAFGKTPPPFSLRRLLASCWLALAHELLKLGAYLAMMAPLLLVNLFVPGVGTIVFSVGGFYVSARFFAYDYLDYCMGRRMWPFSRKWQLLGGNRALTLGFGGSVALVLMIPVYGLLSLPMAAVGGTLLFCDLERAGAFDQAAPPPAA